MCDAHNLRVNKMDETLNRILSLLPKKPDGKLMHGAKKAFAEKIGLNHPQIVSDWQAGRNASYRNYLYQIAEQYDVSVEWLKGETDEKTPAAKMGDERSAKEIVLEKIDEIAQNGSDQELLDLLAVITERLRK